MKILLIVSSKIKFPKPKIKNKTHQKILNLTSLVFNQNKVKIKYFLFLS